MNKQVVTNIQIGYIYKITNTLNQKVYIGQTIQPLYKRWRKYKALSCKNQPKIYNAILKYGIQNFIFEELDSAFDLPTLNALEKSYINIYESVENGYNCQFGSVGLVKTKQRGYKHSELVKAKISQTLKQKYAQNLIPKASQTMSLNNRRKLSLLRKGQPCLKNRGKIPWNKGKHLSIETRQKMSLAKLLLN